MLRHLSWGVYFEWVGIIAVTWYCVFVVRFVVPNWRQRRIDKLQQRQPKAREEYFTEEKANPPSADE